MHYVRLIGLAMLAMVLVQASAYSEDIEAAVSRISALPVDADYGEYLAGECLTCHGVEQSEGVPKISGADKTHFISELIKFQNGTRDNPTMSSIAKALGEDEIASLAEYFSILDN